MKNHLAKQASKVLEATSNTFVNQASPWLTCAPKIPQEMKK